MRRTTWRWRRLWCAGLSLLLVGAAGRAEAEAELRLRVVGGLGGVPQYEQFEKPFWSQTLPRLTAGRVSAEIAAFDQSGIRGQEMLRLMQLGVVSFGTALLSASAAQDPILAAPDLAGLSGSADELKRSLSAFRPQLDRILRERYGLRLLAVYAYPAQSVFCTQPLDSLADLANRRVRTSSVAQSDLVEALGGYPVQLPFAEIIGAVRQGRVDCAITGTLSGNAIGLHEVTRFLNTQPINWGLSVFAANAAAWNTLPPETQQLLLRELARLEQAIFDNAIEQTDDGVACNTGRPTCRGGQRGSMVAVRAADDAARVREVFVKVVLPRWVRRCGADCAASWNRTIGRAAGLTAEAQ